MLTAVPLGWPMDPACIAIADNLMSVCESQHQGACEFACCAFLWEWFAPAFAAVVHQKWLLFCAVSN